MKAMRFFIYLFVGAMAGILACEEIPNKFETEDDLISIADFLYENQETYSSFIRVMEEADLTDAMRAYNPLGASYTLFLPSNEAFDNFIAESDRYGSMDELVADKEFIHALTRYHVVNRSVATHNFPLGALPDSCLTGDYLVIAYIQSADSTYFKINNLALLDLKDLPMTNGVIHVIDHVLEPVTFSGYDWLRQNEDFSILADLFEITGLNEQMGITTTDALGNVIPNEYSILAESNEIYQARGINNIDDLVAAYSNGESDYTSEDNPVYQLAAYHVLDRSWFLADLKEGTSNYNTFASLPLQIVTGVEIKVNPGVENFDSIYQEADSSWVYIDYLEIDLNESNIQTRNGPIHLVNRVIELFKPNRTIRTFEFFEEPLINEVRYEPRTYIWTRPEEFTELIWSGVDEFIYFKGSSSSEKASNRDFISVNGDFSITYTIPKILPGIYGMQMRVNTAYRYNATIQVYLDGKKMGGNLNLTTGGLNNSTPYRIKNMGIIEFGTYEEHTITVRSLIPGVFIWDWVRFNHNIDNYDNNNQ